MVDRGEVLPPLLDWGAATPLPGNTIAQDVLLGHVKSGSGCRLRRGFAGALSRARGSLVGRDFGAVLLLIGMVLLAYVAVQYGRMYWAQRRLAQEWEKQQIHITIPPQELRESATIGSEIQAADRQRAGLIRLRIPSITLDSMVVEGTSDKALALGPGRITNTALPGDHGNSVISGHRDTFFRQLHELKTGDEILVQRSGRTYRFRVTGKQIVKPTDIWVLKPTEDAQLTLITCYPTYYVGPAPKRLVVFSKLEGVHPLSTSQPAVREAAAGASH
jgi:sortase A